MNPEAVRVLLLGFPGVKARGILDSQEFRVRDRVFATLGWPEPGLMVLRLTPADQRRLAVGEAAVPEPGGRGRRGITRVRIDTIDDSELASILDAAWRTACEAAPQPRRHVRKPAANDGARGCYSPAVG